MSHSFLTRTLNGGWWQCLTRANGVPGEAFMLKFSRLSTHLANERTLLAWLRTSAAFFSIGLAFAKVCAVQCASVSTQVGMRAAGTGGRSGPCCGRSTG